MQGKDSLSPPLTPLPPPQVREVTDALRGVSHNGFPVVRDSPSGQVFVGLLTRSHIMAVLQRIVVAGKRKGGEGVGEEGG